MAEPEQCPRSKKTDKDDEIALAVTWPHGQLRARLTWRAWLLIVSGVLSLVTALIRLVAWIIEVIR